MTGLDQTYHAHHLFLVLHFIFLFIPCGGLSWLPVSFLLHVKYTLSYCIVSYLTESHQPRRHISKGCNAIVLMRFC